MPFSFSSLAWAVEVSADTLIESENILAALTGKKEIAPGVLLKKRGSEVEKKYVREFLSSQLYSLGLDSQVHNYNYKGRKGNNL